jgi:EAL domain-containing protein (putative c-di-GMP-specific phosphodiesterase class I)
MDLVRNGELRTAYQPIVELESKRVVGYEALARAPSGSSLESPQSLFAAAAAAGVTEPFDRACREVAVQGALEAGLGHCELLFVNVEPTALSTGGVLDRLSDGELEQLSVVVELTERDLAARPSDVLAAVHWLRQRSCRIALDDVGVDRRSLALMPFLSPDVIKLDIQLTKDEMPEPEAARLLNAVSAEAERSGAILLAEGIEDERDMRRAIALGATLGQGWHFGRPGPIERVPNADLAPPPLSPRHPAETPTQTPFELIAASRDLRRGDKRLLLGLSRQLEREALALSGEAVVISTFQNARFFTPSTRVLYERLSESAALVGALGVGLDTQPGTGVRGASIPLDDPLRGEWDVLVVGPHFASAFVARDLGDGGDFKRRFDYFVTHDRELVLAAARSLLPRILPIA